MKSWKPEVLVSNDSKWYDNGVRLATRSECDSYVRDLEGRWTAVRKSRSTESDDPVTHRWDSGRVMPIGMHDFVDANGPEPEDEK